MKKFCFALLLTFLLHYGYGQNFWMAKGGGATIDEAMAVATDALGNTYVTGYFTSSASFGGNNIVSAGLGDIFVAKYNNVGQIQWLVRAGSINEERSTAIALDAAGNIYIGGYFFNSSQIGLTTLTSAGAQDIFIAKLDNSGNFLWAIADGGTGADLLNGLATDNSGNIIATGEFFGTATFGSTVLNGQGVDVFTVKYNPTGVFQWAKMGTASATDRGLSVACDGADNIYITGQFSHNITFDNVHANTMLNVIFLVKYDAAGNEQWLRKIGGGTYNIANDVATDASGNVYLTGDFGNNLIFFPNTGNPLTNTYANCVFVAQYNSNGDFQWAEADGSSHLVSSKSIAVHGNSHLFIAGEFECKFNEYADVYGQGIFNAVGMQDIFISKYTLTGLRTFSQQVAGKQSDRLKGVAVASDGYAVLAGSFSQRINVPSIIPGFSNFSEGLNAPMSLNYCNDPNYGNFQFFTAQGSSDAMFGKMIPENREPYDFYERTGGNCNRDVEGGCIGPSLYFCFPDTVKFCASGTLYANPFSGYIYRDISPAYTYQWSTGSTAPFITVSVPGTYTLTMTSLDGCIVLYDTIHVIITPRPVPYVSDSKNINYYNNPALPIIFCLPDSIILQGHVPPGMVDYYWDPPLGQNVHDSMLTVNTSGTYLFYVVDSNNCTGVVSVQVVANMGLPQLNLKIIFPTDTDQDDTIRLCGSLAPFQVINEPYVPYVSCQGTMQSQGSIWPNGGTLPYTPCYGGSPLTGTISVGTQGWYVIHDTLTNYNNCDTNVYYVVDSVYIIPFPIPVLNLAISGPPSMCYGDTVALTVTGCDSPSWTGGGIIYTSDPAVVLVTGPGYYAAQCSITDSNGCSANASTFITISPAAQPTLSLFPSNGIICPGDSVQLVCNNQGVSYHWFTPNGDFISTSPVIYGLAAGTYYCAVTYSSGCEMISNTVYLTPYTTPFLSATPDLISCGPFDPVQIQAFAPPGSVLQWQFPLSGSNPIQTVTTPGVYTCQITACNITTVASVTVLGPIADATIAISGNFDYCLDDTITLVGLPGMDSYLWLPGNSTSDTLVLTSPGTYTLIVTDSLGCTDTSQPYPVAINANILVPPDPQIQGVSHFCEGDSLMLACVGCINPVWNGSFLPTTDPTIVKIISPGTIVVACTIVDTNGCFASGYDTLIVTMSPEPVLSINNPDAIICPGDSIELQHTGLGSFTWTTPGGTFTTNQGSFYANLAGYYYCTATDTSGCTFVSNSVVLEIYTTPVISVFPDLLICNPSDSAVITLVVTPGSSIVWAPPLSGSSLQQVVHQSGTYSCSITFCGITTTLQVNIAGALAVAEITASAETDICEGDTVVLTANPGMNSYIWQPGNNTGTTIIVTQSGTYTLQTTDSLGCIAVSSPFDVIIPSNNMLLPHVEDVEFCAPDFVVFHASGNGEMYWFKEADGTVPDGSGTSYYAGWLEAGDTMYVMQSLNGCESGRSQVIAVSVPCDTIVMPTVFTPNGDGYNDFINYFIKDATCFHIEFYNRWGIKIFETSDPANMWTGLTMDGKECVEGVYYYILDYCPKNADPKNQVGFVHLIK